MSTRARSGDSRPSIAPTQHQQPLFIGAEAYDTSGPSVSETTALGLPAAWRAVNLIAHNVAAMKPEVFDGTERVETPIIISRPNPLRTQYETYSEFAAALLLHGNAYAIRIDQQLVPVHPTMVQVQPHEDRVYYLIGSEVYRDDEILHVRGLTMPGQLRGMGVIEAQRRGLGLALDVASYGATSFRSGAVPSALIKVDANELTQDQVTDIQTRWLASHGAGIRKPAVIGKAMTVEPLSFSPQDAEYIEARKLSTADVALMFGLQPEDLGVSLGGNSLTYANLETKVIERLQNAVMPWVIRLEQSLSDLLPLGQSVQLNPDELLRPDRKTRYDGYSVAVASGLLTVNEARAMEGLDALPAAA